MTYEDRKRLESRMARVIDTSWHYSWHWKRTEHGNLTKDGAREALKDAIDLLAQREEQAAELREVIQELAEALPEWP